MSKPSGQTMPKELAEALRDGAERLEEHVEKRCTNPNCVLYVSQGIRKIAKALEAEPAMEALKAEPPVRVKECPHGRGVFAQRDLKAGETLAIYFGVGVPEFQVPDEDTSELAWTNFIDHSESPNTMFAIDTKRKTTVYLVTRNIGKGEELLMDYDYYDKGTIDKALAPTDAEQDGGSE